MKHSTASATSLCLAPAAQAQTDMAPVRIGFLTGVPSVDPDLVWVDAGRSLA